MYVPPSFSTATRRALSVSSIRPNPSPSPSQPLPAVPLHKHTPLELHGLTLVFKHFEIRDCLFRRVLRSMLVRRLPTCPDESPRCTCSTTQPSITVATAKEQLWNFRMNSKKSMHSTRDKWPSGPGWSRTCGRERISRAGCS